MRPRRPLQLLFATTALACLAFFVLVELVGKHGVAIQGDGVGYYIWARSIVIDGDIDFENDNALSTHLATPETRRTPTGKLVNRLPVGMAIVELPAVLAARALETVSGHGPGERPGFGSLYHWFVCVWLLLFGLAGLYAASLRLAEVDAWLATLLAAGSLWATNLPEYLTRSVSYSHLTSVGLVALVWVAGQRGRWLLAGAMMGLMFLVRNTNLAVVPWLVATFFNAPARPRGRDLVTVAAAALAVASLQLVASQALAGSPFAATYPGEGFRWLRPRLWSSLFSIERGWLTWHPWFLMLMALVAVTWPGPGRRAERWVHATCALACVAHLEANASWSAWNFGFSFGHRGYLALVPVLMITVGMQAPRLRERLALDVSRTRRALAVALLVALAVWNVNLWVGFVSGARRGELQRGYVESVSWLFR